ncbi:MAG: DedA family protein [Candidatus Micrarchaeota archaeon]|nr:DedA family protein [Candidatus Micrarchaeota archaeon]
MYYLLAFSIHGLSSAITATVNAWVYAYGYAAIFVLMVLEGATLPVPSEVILPLAGLLASKGVLNFYLALAAATIGSMVGSMIDYAVGYYLGKEVVYKHLQLFHVKKTDLDNFDSWFSKNGLAAVFLTRFIPVLRTVINFPAGFAKMPLKKFLGYTFAGVLIWDIVLMAFGYYLLSVKSLTLVAGGIAVFAIILYVVYRLAASKMRKG